MHVETRRMEYGKRMEMLKCKQRSSDFVLGKLTNLLSYENQLLTVTVLICDEDSPKELGAATISYSQLLAHAEARSKGMLLTVVGSEYYKFTGDGSTSSVLMLVTCSLRTSVPLPGKSKSDEGKGFIKFT